MELCYLREYTYSEEVQTKVFMCSVKMSETPVQMVQKKKNCIRKERNKVYVTKYQITCSNCTVISIIMWV